MIKFTGNKLELVAGKVTIKNGSTSDKNVMIYVSNKDSVPCVVPAGCTVEVTTASAGETYTYLAQATEELTITAATIGA